MIRHANGFDRESALGTRLAFVTTGNAEIDEVSRRGLQGLSRVLADRTALEPATPVRGRYRPRRPLLLSRCSTGRSIPAGAPPGEAQVNRIDAYMKNGGTILFDTRDTLSRVDAAGHGPGFARDG